MSNHELDFFAFNDETTPLRSEGVPMQPPAELARLVNVPELPPRRPYSEEEDRALIGKNNLNFIEPIGEASPKEHSDGTVRTYLTHKNGIPGVALIVDRDDRSPSWFLVPYDILFVHWHYLASMGNGDPVDGIGVLRKLASETTSPKFQDHDINGHLDDMSQIVFGRGLDTKPEAS
jgi:hypothetical protein